MEKKTVTSEFKYLNTYELSGSLESLVKKLQDIEAEATALGFFDVKVEEHAEAYEGTYGFRFFASRLETEEEALFREAKSKKAKLARAKRKLTEKELSKQQKYEEYLKLKKEFEG